MAAPPRGASGRRRGGRRARSNCDQRPDHPHGHRLFAYALLRAGDADAALDAILVGHRRRYPAGRFPGAARVLREDVGLIAAVALRRRPSASTARTAALRARVQAAGATVARTPSLRGVLTWETDGTNVDLRVYDRRGTPVAGARAHQAPGPELYGDVTDGFGPECFVLAPGPGTSPAYPYHLTARYGARGPFGFGAGTLAIVEHDGAGTLRFEERPFVVNTDAAHVDLGTLPAPRAR